MGRVGGQLALALTVAAVAAAALKNAWICDDAYILFRSIDHLQQGLGLTWNASERVQTFTGTVIKIRGGGLGKTFTVRRIVQGEGVERIFPVHSPIIESIKVTRKGRVRRAKLYYLRDRVGKATRLREVLGPRKEKRRRVKVDEPAPIQEAAADEVSETKPQADAQTVEETANQRVVLTATADYDSPAQAAGARAFWDDRREEYAGDWGLRAVGFASALERTQVTATGAQVSGRMELNVAQVRLALPIASSQLRQFDERYGGRAPSGSAGMSPSMRPSGTMRPDP